MDPVSNPDSGRTAFTTRPPATLSPDHELGMLNEVGHRPYTAPNSLTGPQPGVGPGRTFRISDLSGDTGREY